MLSLHSLSQIHYIDFTETGVVVIDVVTGAHVVVFLPAYGVILVVDAGALYIFGILKAFGLADAAVAGVAEVCLDVCFDFGATGVAVFGLYGTYTVSKALRDFTACNSKSQNVLFNHQILFKTLYI